MVWIPIYGDSYDTSTSVLRRLCRRIDFAQPKGWVEYKQKGGGVSHDALASPPLIMSPISGVYICPEKRKNLNMLYVRQST